MFAYGRVLSVNCVGLRPPACWCLSMWVFSRLEELAALRKRIPLYIQWTLRSLTHNGKARCAEYVCVCDVHAGRPTTDSQTPSAAADSPKHHQPHVCVCERGEGERVRERETEGLLQAHATGSGWGCTAFACAGCGGRRRARERRVFVPQASKYP